MISKEDPNPYKIVSLSMIFSTDLSGGYKDSDNMKLLSGNAFYEE